MKVSDNGLAFITREEGCVLHLYNDSAGLQTIGVGHLVTQSEKDRGLFIHGITQEQSMTLLKNDIVIAENAINSLVNVQLNQNQFDALASFTFNLGASALKISTLLKLINAKNFVAAANQFQLWCKRKDPKTGALVTDLGLLHRRQRESILWLK